MNLESQKNMFILLGFESVEIGFSMDNVSYRYARVSQSVKYTLRQCGRENGAVTIVGVTKALPFQIAVAGVQSGIYNLGESRVQEASEKIPVMMEFLKQHQVDVSELTWHMIGKLQSNKAAKAARLFDVIHSVDSDKTARKLSSAAVDEGKVLRVFVEVNTSQESQKGGVPVNSAHEFVTGLSDLENLYIAGLMTIAPRSDDQGIILKSFRTLRELNDTIAANIDDLHYGRQLSMGMSSDYRLAIREGATVVRVGSAIFGPRP